MKIMANYTRAVGFFSSDRRPDAAFFSLSTRPVGSLLLGNVHVLISVAHYVARGGGGEGGGEGVVGEGEGEARRGEGAGEAEVYGR